MTEPTPSSTTASTALPDTIHRRIDADGVAVLTLDDPGQSANTMNEAFVRSFGTAVDWLEDERERITGVIVASAKPTFFAGGDLAMLMAATRADAARIAGLLDHCKALMRRLETLGKPVVAAINGAALGGGFEIALACHHRIALDAPGTSVGLPEVTLGLLPGAGGVTRTVRMLGITAALQQVLLTGTRHAPADALRLGLVDEIAASPEELLTRAKAWIEQNPDAAQPWDRPGFRIPGGTPAQASFAANLPAFPATLRKQLKGAPMPAPKHILAAAVEGAQVDLVSAFAIETRYCTDLVCGQTSANMIKALFFDTQAIAKGVNRPQDVPRATVRKAAVIGAGMMGAGIAYACARAGIDVVLKDVTPEAAASGKAYSERLMAKALEKGRTTQEKADALLARITPTADAADLAGADLVVEAVFESPELKKAVFAEVEQIVAPNALLGSNTSTLPITLLAEGVRRAEDFIGLHFFSPVDRMPLLEIVVGDKTSDTALARAIDFAQQIRKTPIVVNDSRGFFTSRVIGRFLDEAVAMVGEGIPAASVEQAATQAGYPVGALALMDELTLTLPRKIRVETRRGVEETGGTWVEHPAEEVIDRLIDQYGRTGRSGGAGFYDYTDGRRTRLWPGLDEAFEPACTRPPLNDLSERMLFAEALDTVRCLDEGVLRSVAEANVGSILGIGFPAWTGGVVQYINQYASGVPGFVARATELARAYGDRFLPPASLLDLARTNGSLQ
ncbi:3-hydroxyacyl-CoA dehydrogenase NAD-binding domain-containing protein [Streptomyces fulvoviolaceus]|uniref:3-hydroxyacyl-CoA dehydrogenase NAD-binding domain-containing protein n=1 Tax=Streptomyces fulvoviolaceus TaxID=285535 RepID=UPI000A637091|nr:3-hydroxyacyl-CoA dehydrogenase NAD-binding domain-containing protein [Streptomyces fulvoviolaceus]